MSLNVHFFTILLLATLLVFGISSSALAQQSEEKSASEQNKVVTTSDSKKESNTNNINNGSPKFTMPSPLIDQQKKDIQHYMPAHQVTPILAGPDDYLTLITKYTSANSKGVAILLPDWQQGATNPKAINYLAKTLPDHGWTTIAIQPDNKPSNYPSKALTIEKQREENKTTLDAYQNKLSIMLSAVMEKAKTFPGTVLIISQGNHSALLVDLFDQEKNLPANGLIMLSGFRGANNALKQSVNERFAQQLSMSEYPVLDLFLKYDHPLTMEGAKQRNALAQQEMKVYYRQRQLNNSAAGYYPEKELLRQINSWLKSIGW